MSTVILLLLISAVHSVYSNILPVVTNSVYFSTVVVTNCNTQLFVTLVTNCREVETLYTPCSYWSADCSHTVYMYSMLVFSNGVWVWNTYLDETTMKEIW